MRIVDLHCYPNTEPWIRCQGPYVEALAKYWKRDWVGKPEAEVLKDPHLRERGTKHDAPQHLPIAGAETTRRADEIRLDARDAGDRVEQDRKEDAEKDDELVLRVADAEPEDR